MRQKEAVHSGRRREIGKQAGGAQLFHRILKPWFLYQPTQVIRRLWTALRAPTSGYKPLRTSWGISVCADPTRTIGRSILTTGVYDLAVSEVLARLISPGETVIDAGANVGYMTLLAAVAAGPEGKVLTFEPHPELFAVIEKNVGAARKDFQIAQIELHNAALGDRSGTAELLLPEGLAANDGIARIATASDGAVGVRISVKMETLDDALQDGIASVLKLDVEGFELQVLQGAAPALRSGRIRHIVFEEHQIEGSDVVAFLRTFGYRIFAVGWSLRGIALQPVEAGRLATDYEAASYIASIAPEEVTKRCRPRGWSVLRRCCARRRFD
jgi:FkbM family methyltransferase